MVQINQAMENAGKRLAWLLGGVVVLDVLTCIFLAITVENYFETEASICATRLGLTIGLIMAVLQGRKWAKWILVVCASLGSLAVLSIFLMGLTIEAILGASMGVLDILIVKELITNKMLKRYLEHQRAHNREVLNK